MKNTFLQPILIFLLSITLIFSQFAYAADYSSTNFTSSNPVINDFGGDSSSSNFQEIGSGGQIVPGDSASASFQILGGFLGFSSTSVLTQNTFRWYQNADQIQPTVPKAGENIAGSVADQEVVRLRISIEATVQQYPSGKAFKLQYADLNGYGVCGSVPTGNFADIGGIGSGVIWRGYDNSGVTDGAQITANLLSTSQNGTKQTYEEANNSTSTPEVINLGIDADAEWDWAIQNNGATSTNTYCFRMIHSDNTELDAYNNYPSLTVGQYAPKSQNWKWYGDEENETPTDALANENTAPTGIARGNIVKLRLTIKETNVATGTDVKMRVQFDTSSNFPSPTYAADIGSCGTMAWCYADGFDTDNDSVITRVLTDSTANATHNESGTATTTYDHGAGAATEWEFTLMNNGAATSTTYFFRAYDGTNDAAVPINTGENYPSLVTESITLNFSIGGLPIGTNTESITTDTTTTSTSIPFGTLSIDSELEAAQRLTVTTNAESGYQVFVYQRQGFIGGGGIEIDPVTGTNTSPSGWSIGCLSGADGCYGYHTSDEVLVGGSTRFLIDNRYAKFAATAEEVAYSSVPVSNETTDIVYKVQVRDQQEAGTYNSAVVYIAVATF